MQTFGLKDEHIKLGQLLKATGLVGSGVDAKIVVQEGLVKVNGKVCYMRGKKIVSGDIVEFENEKIVLFEDFMKEVSSKDLILAIELKEEGIEKETLEIIKKYYNKANVFITSFIYNALLNVRKLDKTIKIGWLIKEDINQKNILEFMKISGNQICPPADLVSENGIKLARKNNLGVRLWGVSNENIMLKVYNLDIDGMTVNFPDKLNELIMNN